MSIRHRLPVQVDLQRLIRLDGEPGHAGADNGSSRCVKPIAQHGPERLCQFVIWQLRQHAHIEQPVIQKSFGAKLATAARLPPISDGEHEKGSLP